MPTMYTIEPAKLNPAAPFDNTVDAAVEPFPRKQVCVANNW